MSNITCVIEDDESHLLVTFVVNVDRQSARQMVRSMDLGPYDVEVVKMIRDVADAEVARVEGDAASWRYMLTEAGILALEAGE